MNNGMQDEHMELIQLFVQETTDMIEQLEPEIIELGKNCNPVICWETLNCGNVKCVRYKKKVEFPCWLHSGRIEGGLGTCAATMSKQDCLNCMVFELSCGNSQKVNEIFRLFHSIKGSAGCLKLENVTKVAHVAENLLDLIRSGSFRLTLQHVDFLCESCDFTKDALDYLSVNYNDHEITGQAEAMVYKLQQAITDSKEYVESLRKSVFNIEQNKDNKPAAGKTGQKIVSKEGFQLTPNIKERFVQEADELLQEFEQGLLNWINSVDDMKIVSELFRNIHSFKGNCGMLGYADLEKLSHQVETILDAVKSNASIDKYKSAKVLLPVVDVLKDVVVSVAEGGKENIDNLDLYLEVLGSLLPKGWQDTDSDSKSEHKRLGDILCEQGAVTSKEIDAALEEQRRSLGEILIDKGDVEEEQIEIALKRQKEINAKLTITNKRDALETKTFKPRFVKRQDIRVDLNKLDNLINLIGELVITENVLVNNPDLKGLKLGNFNRVAQQMNKLVRELQTTSMTIRMIPISGLFRRMIRLVHDLSNKSGKKVDLQLHGEETELDKTVIERVSDPLVHLMRNCVDHGLELPEERVKSGKPGIGIIRLSARHEEGNVWIIIEDDGSGLNREKILAKAAEKGLIEGDGAELSDKEVFAFIFKPGFSTAEKITDISGRGVGMDVVAQNLQKIRGKVEVYSKKGHGTKIILKIPLTLAIIDGMLLQDGDTKCILPLLSIKESFRPALNSITVSPNGQEIVRVRENFFPVLRLHKVLKKNIKNKELHEGILILVEAHEKGVCLFVNKIIGQQQTVIKGLSDYVGNVRGVSGCTILGSGEVSLILDPGSLIEISEKG
jgi:two-component system chemotaxis sensor kinase CheA